MRVEVRKGESVKYESRSEERGIASNMREAEISFEFF